MRQLLIDVQYLANINSSSPSFNLLPHLADWKLADCYTQLQLARGVFVASGKSPVCATMFDDIAQ